MRNLASTIAWRYLTFKGKDKNISFMIKICFLGILIGTFALMLTLIITNGFEKAIHKKMQGINAQIIITAPGGNKLDYVQIRNSLLQEFPQQIAGISGSSMKQAILEKNKTQSIIFLKGIDEEHESEVTNLDEKIQPQENSTQKIAELKHLLRDNQILVGHKLAKEHNLKTGDKVTLMIPEPTSKKKIVLKKQNIVVAGVFNIGLEEYDNNFAFTTLDFLNETFDEEGSDQVTLKMKDEPTFSVARFAQQAKLAWNKNGIFDLMRLIKNKLSSLFLSNKEDAIITLLKFRLPHLNTHSWKDLYPALVSSLKLEKYVMFFILALITLVASMNMISLLFMQIQHKRRDIAIFTAMGMPAKKIRSIFLRIGMSITLLASIFGLGFAALAGYFLERYPFITLPDVYYVSYLPAHMDPEIFFVVFVATLFMGFFATWLPAKRLKKINVTNILREE